MNTETEVPVHPVQNNRRMHTASEAPQVVTLRAYEVYRHVHGDQHALIIGECRGGFSAGELVAFLYARSFPKDEWRWRCAEAFRGMKNL